MHCVVAGTTAIPTPAATRPTISEDSCASLTTLGWNPALAQALPVMVVPSIVQIRDRPLSCCLPQTKFTPISRLALRATSRNRILSITCCAGATFIAFTMLPPSGTIVLARHELCTNYFKHAGICATLTAECSSLRHDYPDGTPRHYLPLSEAGGLWRAPHDVPATRQL